MSWLLEDGIVTRFKSLEKKLKMSKPSFYEKYKTYIWVSVAVFIVIVAIIVLAVTGVFSGSSGSDVEDDDFIDSDDLEDEAYTPSPNGGGGSGGGSGSPSPSVEPIQVSTTESPVELQSSELIVDSVALNEDILSQSDVEVETAQNAQSVEIVKSSNVETSEVQSNAEVVESVESVNTPEVQSNIEVAEVEVVKSSVTLDRANSLSTFIDTFDQVKVYKPETKIGNDVYKLSRLIPSIVYVHMRPQNGVDEKYTLLKSEIGKLDLDGSVNHIGIITQLPSHILPSQRTEKMLELEYLANMTALAKAVQVKNKKYHLIVQSSFSFVVSPEELYKKLEYVNISMQDSWDVIYFAQDMLAWQKLDVSSVDDEDSKQVETICRVLSSRHRKAYLIKTSYIRKLLLYYKNLYQTYLAQKKSPLYNVYQLQYELIQKTNTLENDDIWIAYKRPIGKIDNHVIAYDDDLRTQIDEKLFHTTEVKLLSDYKVHDVVAVIISTTNNTGFISQIVGNLKSNFLKGHRLHIVVATSKPLLFAGYSEPNTYVIPVRKFTDENDEDVFHSKFRFYYMLEIMSKLNGASPIKPSYWYMIHEQYNVYQHLENSEVLQDLIVSKYIDPVIDKVDYMIDGKHPEERSTSKAYLDRSKFEDVVYSSDFVGGSSLEMEALCKSVKGWMTQDIKLGIIARWYDESYLNKYLKTSKSPTNVIKLSSIYSVKCFNSKCMDLYCQTKR